MTSGVPGTMSLAMSVARVRPAASDEPPPLRFVPAAPRLLALAPARRRGRLAEALARPAVFWGGLLLGGALGAVLCRLAVSALG